VRRGAARAPLGHFDGQRLQRLHALAHDAELADHLGVGGGDRRRVGEDMREFGEGCVDGVP
jgi:hypothetical protein